MNTPWLASMALGMIALTPLSAIAQNINQTSLERTEIRTQTHTVVYRNPITVLNRAKNYARQAAEKRNGGLRVYRAEALMHGPVEQTRFVENNDGTVTFTFYGGAPAVKPTIESVVTVAVNGWATKIDYNGPIRSR
ncbi:hypothetical protein OsccyDRAFT_1906 [Leptolyngbyaceae cyanobacterium JSC-12]|nr:hypothetical protein OsccyDRAFT_1906 [Leptolyngbyaceae cyanobacterium JSC-12]